MTAKFGLVSAYLATVCLGSVLYGIFLVLAIVSLWLFIRHRKRILKIRRDTGYKCGLLHVDMFIAAVMLELLANTYWISNISRLFQAFVYYEDGSQPLEYYADLSQVFDVVQTGSMVFTLVLTDATIVYRLWVVWDYDKRIIVAPICTLTGLAGKYSIALEVALAQIASGISVFDNSIGHWVTGLCVLTLSTNLYSTSMIVWMVWPITCHASYASKFGGGSLLRLLTMIAESAALYTLWSAIFLIAYLLKSNVQLVANETLSVAAGISFTLMNVRIGIGWEQETDG
ncbi:hypothetical protein WOLCODRAFT_53482, partial [Wolfiporia cocos MD-104 SS10]